VEEYAKKFGVTNDTCEDKVSETDNSTGDSVKIKKTRLRKRLLKNRSKKK